MIMQAPKKMWKFDKSFWLFLLATSVMVLGVSPNPLQSVFLAAGFVAMLMFLVIEAAKLCQASPYERAMQSCIDDIERTYGYEIMITPEDLGKLDKFPKPVCAFDHNGEQVEDMQMLAISKREYDDADTVHTMWEIDLYDTFLDDNGTMRFRKIEDKAVITSEE